MEEENFTKYKLESARENNYKTKTDKNNTKREFVEEYLNPNKKTTTNLLRIAGTYMLLEKGIFPETYPAHEINITQNELDELFLKIKSQADKNFIKFYKSYLKKIKLGYYPEYIESALNDAKTAYYTFRKCNVPEWECPDKMITKSEMENLYNILTESKSILSNEEKNK